MGLGSPGKPRISLLVSPRLAQLGDVRGIPTRLIRPDLGEWHPPERRDGGDSRIAALAAMLPTHLHG